MYQYVKCPIEKPEWCSRQLRFYNKITDAPIKLEP